MCVDKFRPRIDPICAPRLQLNYSREDLQLDISCAVQSQITLAWKGVKIHTGFPVLPE